MFEAIDNLNSWMFLSVTGGLSLIAIYLSYSTADHGRGKVDEARRHLDRLQRKLAGALRKAAEIDAHYKRHYRIIRSHALHLIEMAKELMHFYLQVLQQHAIRKVDVLIPEISLPLALEAEEPPPLSTVVAEYRSRRGRL
jgi:hypothetical protein